MARAAPPALSSQRAASIADGWTHLRVSDPSGSVELTRDQAGRVAQLASSLARETQREDALQEPPSTRIEFTRQGELMDVLELAGPQLRWTRWRGGQRESFTLRPQPAELQSLRDEIERLVKR
jgi:hypothetical protein